MCKFIQWNFSTTKSEIVRQIFFNTSADFAYFSKFAKVDSSHIFAFQLKLVEVEGEDEF